MDVRHLAGDRPGRMSVSQSSPDFIMAAPVQRERRITTRSGSCVHLQPRRSRPASCCCEDLDRTSNVEQSCVRATASVSLERRD